jgi:hypothetical protein
VQRGAGPDQTAAHDDGRGPAGDGLTRVTAGFLGVHVASCNAFHRSSFRYRGATVSVFEYVRESREEGVEIPRPDTQEGTDALREHVAMHLVAPTPQMDPLSSAERSLA